jgi:hypothetical protein
MENTFPALIDVPFRRATVTNTSVRQTADACCGSEALFCRVIKRMTINIS